MLVSGGYKPTVIVVEGFVPKEMYAHPDVKLAYIPHFPVDNNGQLPDNYKELVQKTKDALMGILASIDVCITHDIIYQPAHLIHNLASREVAVELVHLRWLHWIHSATSPEILCSAEDARPLLKRPFPNALICYPNYADIPRVAVNYGWEEDFVKWVPHPVDIPDYLGMHPLSKKLVQDKKILQADVIAVYPARLDRGKQPEHIIKIMGAIKKSGRSVRLVIMDFHSTGGDKLVYRDDMKRIAQEWQVADEVTWLSEYDESLKYEAPRQMVRDLMLISNVYIHPSVSETYSLATQEAAICKNILVLNKDFPPMAQLWGQWPIYRQFSSAINSTTGFNGDTMWNHSDGTRKPYPENQAEYYAELAMNINYYLENNAVLMEHRMVRQKRSIEYVFKTYVEPLLYR